MAATSRFAVAVHVAAVLAYRGSRGQAWVSSASIAESVNTNAVVVRRTLSSLVRAGLVETRLGADGGARLARRPREVRLLEIYRAVAGDEGVLAFSGKAANRTCSVSRGIKGALMPVFESVEASMEKALARETLAGVLGRLPA